MSCEIYHQLRESLLQLRKDFEKCQEVWTYMKKKRWLNRRWHKRSIYKKRLTHGDYFTTFEELKLDPDFFFKYTRLTLEAYKYFLYLVKPKIIILKNRIDVPKKEERVAITLR